MDLISIKNFTVAAEYLNFTRAAGECGLTQTAMSAQISKLEEEAGFRLFDRNNREVRLTRAGESFLLDAKRILDLHESSISKGRLINEGYEGTLKISFPNYLGRLNLPSVISGFHKKFPSVDLEINQSENWSILEDLKYGKTDIIQAFPYDLLNTVNIDTFRMGTFCIVAAVKSDSPEALLPKIPISVINKSTVIIHEDPANPEMGRILQRDWEGAGISPSRIKKTRGLDSILLLVESGFGMSLLPEYVKTPHTTRGISFIPIENFDIKLEVVFAWLKTNQNPVLHNFIRELSDLF